MIRNLIVTGIGGQGVLFLSTLLRRAVGRKFGRFTGYDDRGGAQRYGHVASVLRFSDDPAYDGPMAIDFPDGEAHWVIGLEAGEPLRFDRKLAAGTVVVADTYRVAPTNVRRQDGEYFTAHDLAEHYRARGCLLEMADFRGLARQASGNPLDGNLLALGALLRHTKGLLGPDDFEAVVDPRQMELLRRGAAGS